MATFTVYYAKNPLKTYELSDSVITVGRLPENTICIASMSISRRHVKIESDSNNEYHITDLNSLNGTYVNKNRIKKSLIKSSDEIAIGKYTIVFSSSQTAQPKSDTDSISHVVIEENQKNIPKPQDTAELSRNQDQEIADKPIKIGPDAAPDDTVPTAVLIETNKHVVYKLDKPLIYLGNSESDDIFISGMFVGPQQVVVEKDDTGYWIKSDKMMSKLKVNGKKEKSYLLQHKDKIEIGDNTYRFMENG